MMLDYLLTLYPNPRPQIFLSKLASTVSYNCAMSCLTTFPKYFSDLPLSLLTPTIVNLLTRVCAPFHMSEISQTHLPHLVHHRGLSHLVPNIFDPNLIFPSMLKYSSQHPYFHYFHILDMQVLDQPTLCKIQHNWCDHYYIKLSFKAW